MPLPTELLLKKEELGPGSEGMGARKLLGLVREELGKHGPQERGEATTYSPWLGEHRYDFPSQIKSCN